MDWRGFLKGFNIVGDYTYDTVSSTTTTDWYTNDPWNIGTVTTTGTDNAWPNQSATWIRAQQQQQSQADYYNRLMQWKRAYEKDQKEHDRLLLQDIRAKANKFAALILAEQGCGC